MSSTDRKLYIETPLMYSKVLSEIISNPVYLKLENVQHSHAFKFRGFLASCQARLREKDYKGFCTFSAGNGGLSLATVAQTLRKECHVFLFLPDQKENRMLNKIRKLGAQTSIFSDGLEALHAVQEFQRNHGEEWVFMDPHSDEDVWDGYSTMVVEIRDQLPNKLKPSCIVCSVGGGGLLIGLLKGLEKVGWDDVPVVAMETIGAHAFNKSVAAGKPVHNVLTSVAKSLGAPGITPKVFDVLPKFKVISETLSDLEAVKACLRFSDDHTFLVEPAAGVSLATVYTGKLPGILEDSGFDITTGPVVVLVCGGNDTNYARLSEYVRDFELEA